MSHSEPSVSLNIQAASPLPLHRRGRIVGYRHSWYPVLLGSIVLGLLVINVIAVAGGQYLSLIAALVQAAILGSLFAANFVQVILVRLWACLLLVAGVSGIVKIVADLVVVAVGGVVENPTSLRASLFTSACLIAGIYFVRASGREPVFAGSAAPPNTA